MSIPILVPGSNWLTPLYPDLSHRGNVNVWDLHLAVTALSSGGSAQIFLGDPPLSTGHGLAGLLIRVSHPPRPEVRHTSLVGQVSQKLRQAAQRLKTFKPLQPTAALKLIGSWHQVLGADMVLSFPAPTSSCCPWVWGVTVSFRYTPFLSNLAKSWSLVVASLISTINSPIG